MAPKTTTESGTVLARMIIERLRQLGVSRRQFCIQSGISRQTLYEIEYKGKVNLLTQTLVSIDNGCRWEAGTALRYATGDEHARDTKPVDERVSDYISRIIIQLSRLSVDELEREAIWLEEELFGRKSSDSMDAMRLIHDASNRMINSDRTNTGKSGH